MVEEKGESKIFTKQFYIQLVQFLFVSLYNQHCLVSGYVFRTVKSQKRNPNTKTKNWPFSRQLRHLEKSKICKCKFKYKYKFQKAIRIPRSKAWSVHNCHAEILKARGKNLMQSYLIHKLIVLICKFENIQRNGEW